MCTRKNRLGRGVNNLINFFLNYGHFSNEIFNFYCGKKSLYDTWESFRNGEKLYSDPGNFVELHHEKTNTVVFEQVQHKASCTRTDGLRLELLDLERHCLCMV